MGVGPRGTAAAGACRCIGADSLSCVPVEARRLVESEPPARKSTQGSESWRVSEKARLKSATAATATARRRRSRAESVALRRCTGPTMGPGGAVRGAVEWSSGAAKGSPGQDCAAFLEI